MGLHKSNNFQNETKTSKAAIPLKKIGFQGLYITVFI